MRQTVLRNDWIEALTPEQQERVRQANATWLGPFAAFTARFGGHGESPVSVANLKNVLQQVMRLVSGAGVTCKQRAGCFAEGRPINLGVTAAECDALRAEAQLWAPLKTAPADLIGMSVNGEVVPRKPPGGIVDTSNGWLLNHPLMKVRLYCEHLDEVAATSFEATMARLLGHDAPAPKTEEASTKAPVEVAAAAASPKASAEESSSSVPFTLEMVGSVMRARGIDNLSAKIVRETLEAELGLAAGGLKPWKREMIEMIDEQIEMQLQKGEIEGDAEAAEEMERKGVEQPPAEQQTEPLAKRARREVDA